MNSRSVVTRGRSFLKVNFQSFPKGHPPHMDTSRKMEVNRMYLRDYSGGHYITPNGGIGYRNTLDGHGGRSREHREEMRQIAM